MVPRTLSANFNDIDPKLPEFLLHLHQFFIGLNTSRILSQLVPEGVPQLNKGAFFTDWTGPFNTGAMKLGSFQQIRISVAGINFSTVES